MFNINGQEWRVLLVSPSHPKLKTSKYEKVLGTCDNIDKTIYIDNSLSPAYMRKVLCHEITHAAMFSYYVNLTYEQEEIIADILATYGQEIIAITNKVFNKIKGTYY